jgi:hypothetical protein
LVNKSFLATVNQCVVVVVNLAKYRVIKSGRKYRVSKKHDSLFLTYIMLNFGTPEFYVHEVEDEWWNFFVSLMKDGILILGFVV